LRRTHSGLESPTIRASRWISTTAVWCEAEHVFDQRLGIELDDTSVRAAINYVLV
jgi:hypothetical protein